MRFQGMTLRLVRSVFVFGCLFPGMLTAAAQERAAQSGAQTLSSSPDPASSDLDTPKTIAIATAGELPESPGAVRAQQQTSPEQTQPPSSAPSEPQAATSQPTQSQPMPPAPQPGQQSQPAPQQPVGTAAAETSKASGVAASQPAGVAIAPAKQRRVRTIVIRVGAILGAGAAVGTVVALTQATSSKPPGTH